jgi:signal transduction histidine kinase
MLKIWSKLCNLGISEQNNDSLNRRIKLSNQLAIIFSLLALFMIPVFALSVGDITGASAAALAILVSVAALVLNSKGLHKTARLLLCGFIIVVGIAIPILTKVIDVSQRDVTHYYSPRLLILVSLIIPFFLFDLSRRMHQIVYTIFALAAFLSFDPLHNLAGVGIDQVEITFKHYGLINAMGSACLLIAIFGLMFMSKSNREYERQLIAAKNEAEHAVKIKGEFLSLMSHEIRTPLNAVLGMANLLIQEDPREDQKEKIDVLKLSGKTLLNLINDILDYNKMESGNVEVYNSVCNLPLMMMEVHKTYETQATRKGVELLLEVGENIPRNILTDEGRLKQILTNLVGNAIKFTSEGHVTLGAHAMAISPESCRVIFSVHDTGIGIDEEHQEVIFDSFKQATTSTTKSFGGTGLGLAISKSLSQLLGGDLVVDSRLGNGARFHFTIDLPIASPEEIFKAEDTPQDVIDLTGYRFLVAEDNELNILVAKGFFEKWGAHVTVARNGEEAVEWMRSSDFDMIFMDLHMPIMDGIEATTTIRKFNTDIPIIALTASAMLKQQHEVFTCGMNEIVAKPFDPIELNHKIMSLLS